MRGALADAVQAGVVDRNVARELRAPRKKRKPVRALSEKHVAQMIDALRTPIIDPVSNAVLGREDNLFSDAATLQFLTGARVGEICALRWIDVALQEESVVITFRATVISRQGPARIQEEPKTAASNRSLRLKNPVAIALLARRLRDQTHEELVFPGDKGGVLSPHTVQARWRKARVAFGSEVSWITPHIARRSLVTTRAEQGWTFEDIARAVGHSDPGTSRRIYTKYRLFTDECGVIV
jgi:integrase